MIEEQARHEYIAAAAAHGAATDCGDSKKTNLEYDKIMRALAMIRKTEDRGRSTLALLLEHENPHVRCWAATHLLPLDQDAAMGALEALTSEPPFVCIDAKMVLREWRAGKLKLP